MATTSVELITDRPQRQDAEPTLLDLEARVSERGRALAAAVGALRGEVRQATDWRTHITRHPYWALGAAAAVGLASASLLRRRPHPQARLLEAAALGLESLQQRLRGARGAASSRPAGSLVRAVVGALATRMLRQRLSRRLEGLGVSDLLGPSPSRARRT